MSGNTRGKLKEHFEGIHKNLDWCVHHCNISMALIAAQLQFTEDYIKCEDNPEAQQEILDNNSMYGAIKGLGEGIQTLDDLAGGIYEKF